MPKPALAGMPSRTISRYQPYLAGFSPVSRIRATIVAYSDSRSLPLHSSP